MQGKVHFWTGLVLCLAGVAITVIANGRTGFHVLGALVVAIGAVIAWRNAHA